MVQKLTKIITTKQRHFICKLRQLKTDTLSAITEERYIIHLLSDIYKDLQI